MAQCRGTTRKGERCRREAGEGSHYCSFHEPESAESGGSGWNDELTDTAKTVLGLAVAAIVVGAYLLRGGRI